MHHRHATQHTTTILWPFVQDYPGEPIPEDTHPPTILIIIQSSSASSVYHDPLHPPCSNDVLGNLFAQLLSMSSLVYLLVWSPPPHIPYISSPNQCLLFARHAHTMCFTFIQFIVVKIISIFSTNTVN